MPKSSEEQAQARRDEIVNACAELYETMSFRDITLKEIGQRTSLPTWTLCAPRAGPSPPANLPAPWPAPWSAAPAC